MAERARRTRSLAPPWRAARRGEAVLRRTVGSPPGRTEVPPGAAATPGPPQGTGGAPRGHLARGAPSTRRPHKSPEAAVSMASARGAVLKDHRELSLLVGRRSPEAPGPPAESAVSCGRVLAAVMRTAGELGLLVGERRVAPPGRHRSRGGSGAGRPGSLRLE